MGVGDREFSVSGFVFEPLDGESLWFYPLEPGQTVDLSAPALEKVRREAEQIDSNQRAVLLVMLQDVSRAYTQQEEAGLDSPTEGRVLWNGQELAGMDLDAYRREKAAVIFQAFQLFPLMTASENICYPMELNGAEPAAARRRADELLARVGLSAEKGRHFPANLSGGEQQRVAIARALATGASLILADEPTGNLDGENRQNILEILCRLAHEDGYCVIVVTHGPGGGKGVRSGVPHCGGDAPAGRGGQVKQKQNSPAEDTRSAGLPAFYGKITDRA